jgi:hypothetical protein
MPVSCDVLPALRWAIEGADFVLVISHMANAEYMSKQLPQLGMAGERHSNRR